MFNFIYFLGIILRLYNLGSEKKSFKHLKYCRNFNVVVVKLEIIFDILAKSFRN